MIFLIFFITYTARSITIGGIWLFVVLVLMLLVQVVLTLASVQRLTISDVDCHRSGRRNFVPHTGGCHHRRRCLELQ